MNFKRMLKIGMPVFVLCMFMTSLASAGSISKDSIDKAKTFHSWHPSWKILTIAKCNDNTFEKPFEHGAKIVNYHEFSKKLKNGKMEYYIEICDPVTKDYTTYTLSRFCESYNIHIWSNCMPSTSTNINDNSEAFC